MLHKGPNKFIMEIKKFLHTVSFSFKPTEEFRFEVTFLTILYNSKLLKVDSKLILSRDRSDVVVIYDDTIHITDLKVNLSPKLAIKQIEEKNILQSIQMVIELILTQ